MKLSFYAQPKDLPGESVRVFLKQGGNFLLHVTESSENHFSGIDNEGLDLRVDIKDLDFAIIGG